jgi:peroxiredoxin Q/BCP
MAELTVGQKAPEFSLEASNGKKVSLKDYKGKTVVLYFYPKDMTSGCTTEACDFRDNLARVENAGAVVLGVSPDNLTSHGKFIEKNNLNFLLLADPEKKVLEAYGIWKEKSLYGRKFMGVVRSTFIIGPDGKIAHIFPKVSVKGHVDAVLEVLKTIK